VNGSIASAPARSPWPWLVLPSRLVLFAATQAVFALVFALAGSAAAWDRSVAWWMYSAVVANVVCFVALVALFRRDGGSYGDLWKFDRITWWKDLLLSIAGLAVAGPIAILPMQWLGAAFLGSYDAAIATLFQPLPVWALWLALLFPLTMPFGELAIYFGYAMPRLERRIGSGWLAWLLASLALSLQHAALPLVVDGPFIAWRALMYLPFALYIGLVVKWRPRLLPFLMIGHGLIDVSTWMVYLSR
jgi:membrane protease YdiL (CAAX protease family)